MFGAAHGWKRRIAAVGLAIVLAAGAAQVAEADYLPGPPTRPPPWLGPPPTRPPPKPEPPPPPRGQTMPGVTGMHIVFAQMVLVQHGLFGQTQSAPSSQPQGFVTAQDPPAGAPIRQGQPVRLWVSSGPPQRQPPPPRPTPIPPPPLPAPIPPRPWPEPRPPLPIPPAPPVPQPLPYPIRPQPKPQPYPPQPQPMPQPTRVVTPVVQPTPPQPQPVVAAQPQPPAPAPVVAPPAPPALRPLDWPETHATLLALAAFAAAAAAAAGAWLLRRRPPLPASGATVPFAVTTTIAAVHAAARDVHPTAAPTIGLNWTVTVLPPRIEGLDDKEPLA